MFNNVTVRWVLRILDYQCYYYEHRRLTIKQIFISKYGYLYHARASMDGGKLFHRYHRTGTLYNNYINCNSILHQHKNEIKHYRYNRKMYSLNVTEGIYPLTRTKTHLCIPFLLSLTFGCIYFFCRNLCRCLHDVGTQPLNCCSSCGNSPKRRL